jgi:hypothetical protein
MLWIRYGCWVGVEDPVGWGEEADGVGRGEDIIMPWANGGVGYGEG